MSAWRLASRPPTRPATRVLVSPLCSLFIVHPCRSKQDGGVVSRLPACLVPRLVKSFAPLPVASLTAFVFAYSVSSLVPSCVSPPVSFSCRLAFRPVLISSRLARCAARLSPVLRSCRFVQLVSPFSPCFAVLSSPHGRMAQDGHGYRITPIGTGKQEANEPQGTRTHAHRNDTGARRPRRNISSHTRKTIRRMKRKTRRAGKTPRQDDMTRRRDSGTG